MKIGTFLLFVIIFQLSAGNLFSQNATIDLSLKNVTVEEILDRIENETGYTFLFTDKTVDVNRRLDMNIRTADMEEVLNLVFDGTNVKYDIVDKQVILSARTVSSQPSDQEKIIKGVVYDEYGDPIIGANVVEKGTTNGTVTGLDGDFTLNVSDKAILIVSYIGYLSKEIPVNNVTTFNIKLDSDVQQLNEVVAIGFGVVKKVNLTGAVSALNTKDIEKLKVTQTSQLLAGMVSGINVTQGSARPGGDQSHVRVRGLGTFSPAGNEPLVLVDGLASSLDNVNVNDIESISVLKDAASASIYGARAANGVILIETKKGKEGKARITYQGNFGFSRPSTKPKIVDSWVYAEMYNEALINGGGSPQYTAEEIAKFKSGEDPDNYANKRHYDDLVSSGSGFQTNHHISFTGGTGKSSYMFSLGYLNQQGIIAETDYKRYNVMFNISGKLMENLKINAKFSGQKGDSNQPTAVDPSPKEGVEGLIDYSIKVPNTIAGKKSDGYYGHQTGFTIEGWMDSESFIRNNDVDALANASIEWNILKDLKFTGVGGYNFTSFDYKMFRPTLIVDETFTSTPSNLRVKNTRRSLFTLQAYLDYDWSVNNHFFHFLAGYSQESFKEEYVEAYRDNFPSNTLYEINAGSASNQQNSGTAFEWALASFFGRLSYSYKDRYLLEVNARYDGSSRFPKKNRFGLFPSVSGGWNIAQEEFFHVAVMNNLKLRASWGKLGNQNIGNYPYQQVIALGLDAPFGVSEVLWPGAAATEVPNQDITWESTEVANIGLDVGLFNNKLTFSTDLYSKETSDILYNVTASAILGMTPSVQNAGVVSNKGIDFTIQHRNVIGDFSYGISANVSYVKNEVKRLANVEKDIIGGLFIGHSLKSFYGYVVDGFFNSQEEVDNYAKQPRTARPGDLKLVDISGPDGVPDGVVNGDYDRKIIGAQFPKYNFGFNINAQYKNVDFLLNMSGVAGIDRLVEGFQGNAFHWGSNPQEWMAKGRWTENNHDATYPRLLVLGGGEQQFYTSTYRIYDASFLRINDIQLGYTIPSGYTKALGISNLRVYGSIRNLATFHNFLEGWDPERTGLYPAIRNFMGGLSITF